MNFKFAGSIIYQFFYKGTNSIIFKIDNYMQKYLIKIMLLEQSHDRNSYY